MVVQTMLVRIRIVLVLEVLDKDARALQGFHYRTLLYSATNFTN